MGEMVVGRGSEGFGGVFSSWRRILGREIRMRMKG